MITRYNISMDPVLICDLWKLVDPANSKFAFRMMINEFQGTLHCDAGIFIALPCSLAVNFVHSEIRSGPGSSFFLALRHVVRSS